MTITNAKLTSYGFLADMYRDGYFPNAQVDKVRQVLVDLCEAIETKRPSDTNLLLALTHAATVRINGLQQDFEDHGSDLETAAREAIGADFAYIADAYGFGDIDTEDLIAPRDW